MTDSIPDDHATADLRSVDRVDTRQVCKHAQSDIVDIIELDHGPHTRVIPDPDNDSDVRLVVNTVVGNNIVVAVTNVNTIGAVKDLATFVNVVVDDHVVPCLGDRSVRWE